MRDNQYGAVVSLWVRGSLIEALRSLESTRGWSQNERRQGGETHPDFLTFLSQQQQQQQQQQLLISGDCCNKEKKSGGETPLLIVYVMWYSRRQPMMRLQRSRKKNTQHPTIRGDSLVCAWHHRPTKRSREGAGRRGKAAGDKRERRKYLSVRCGMGVAGLAVAGENSLPPSLPFIIAQYLAGLNWDVGRC